MSEGQPKVSLRRSQVPLPVAPRARPAPSERPPSALPVPSERPPSVLPVPSERPPSASMPRACVCTRRKIKHEGTAPVPPAQPPFVSCSRGFDPAVVSLERGLVSRGLVVLYNYNYYTKCDLGGLAWPISSSCVTCQIFIFRLRCLWCVLSFVPLSLEYLNMFYITKNMALTVMCRAQNILS